jgi:hypothetical protein
MLLIEAMEHYNLESEALQSLRRAARVQVVPPAKRLAVYIVLIVVGLFAIEWYRRWAPLLTIETQHYIIYSSATAEQTAEVGDRSEILYSSYSKLFGGFPGWQPPKEKLKAKLYKDRSEFRRVHLGIGWAEAFYRPPFTEQYYDAGEGNTYHWAIHEGVHQLNHQGAHFNLPQWADEGLAGYFCTSAIENGRIILGRIDWRTYPVWWLSKLGPRQTLQKDIQDGEFIPLRVILTGQGGPNMNDAFNRYYLEWWSLIHFIFHFEQGRYRGAFLKLLQDKVTLESFVSGIGPLEVIEPEWFGYLHKLTAETGR